MAKFIITAELRELEKQVLLEEISYSRMIEILNEKAEKWCQDRIENERNDNLCKCESGKSFHDREWQKKECGQCKKQFI
jgi:hypothetical protein